MKVVRQARLELSGGSTPDQLSPPPPPGECCPPQRGGKPQKDVVYYVVTGNRGHWSTAPVTVTKAKKRDMGRCNLYFTQYTRNTTAGWTVHNLIY